MATQDALYIAFEALSRAKVSIDRYANYDRLAEKFNQSIYDYPRSYDTYYGGENPRFMAAIRDLSAPTSYFESRISGLWASLPEDKREERQAEFFVGDPLNALAFVEITKKRLEWTKSFGRLVGLVSDDLPAGAYGGTPALDKVLGSEFAPRRSFLKEFHNPPKAPARPDALDGKKVSELSQARDKDFNGDVKFEAPYALENAVKERSAELTLWHDATMAFFTTASDWISWAERETAPKAFGDILIGGTKNVTTVTFGDGTVINAPLTIAGSIENSLNNLQSGQAPADMSAAIEALLKAIATASQDLPEDKAEDMALDGETVAKELSRATPRKAEAQSKLTSIAKTAEALGKAALPILDAVKKLLPFLA